MIRRALACLLLLSVYACGSDSPSSPTPPVAPNLLNVAGLWSGTYSSATLGFGTALLSLSQNGGGVLGTWSSRPDPNGGAGLSGGTITAVISTRGTSGSVTFLLSPSNPLTCSFQATLEVFQTQGQMAGQWAAVNCSVTATGTLILARQ